MNSKRELFSIVITLIIIVLSLVAVGVILGVVSNLPSEEQNNLLVTNEGNISSINEQTTSESLTGGDFFPGIIFKIILGAIGLIVLGIIAFVIIKKGKKSSSNNSSEKITPSNPVLQEKINPNLSFSPLPDKTSSE